MKNVFTGGWRRTHVLVALAMSTLPAQLVLAGPIFHEETATKGHAAPRFLESEVSLQPGAAFLDLTLRTEIGNRNATDIVVDVRVSADGEMATFRFHSRVNGRQTADIPVRLPISVFRLPNLNYSGRLTADVMLVAQNKMISYAAALETYYHPEGGKVLFYGASILRQRYAAGNFQRRNFPEQTIAEYQARAALRQAGGGAEPALARVMRLPITSGGTSNGPTGQKRFCLFMNSDAYWDSSGRQWVAPSGDVYQDNYGEDYGINGAPLPMARAWVAVSQQGNALFTGYMDQFGCTPYVPAASNVPTSIMLFLMYRHPASNLRTFVSDLNLGPSWPQTMPYFHLELPASAWPVVFGWGDPEERTQTMYTVAAASVERFPGGLTNMQYEFRLGQQESNQGTGTNYNEVGDPMVYVKHGSSDPLNGTTARSKFTLSHEYGHAVLMAKLNPPLQPGDLDYSVEAGEANQHTMTSKEWQLVAAVEGLAHYVAGVVWNDATPFTDAYYVNGKSIHPLGNDVYALHLFEKRFESNYSPAQYPDQGIEMDWAQFFWNYQTDVPWLGVLPVSQGEIVQMWKQSHPWPVQQGFYADFASGAGALVFGHVLPGFQAELPVQYFQAVAAAAGIAH